MSQTTADTIGQGNETSSDFLAETLLLEAVIVFVIVEIFQGILRRCGSQITTWMEQCNGKCAHIRLKLWRVIFFQKTFDKVELLAIGTSLEQASLSFVILAVMVPCLIIVVAYGNISGGSLEKEGEKEALILYIAAMTLMFKTEAVLDANRARVKSANSSIFCVILIWAVSLILLSTKQFDLLTPPTKFKKGFQDLESNIIIERDFFLIRYFSLFWSTGIFRKPVYTSRKKQFWYTTVWCLWISTIFLSLQLSKKRLESFFEEKSNLHEITYILFVVLCQWEGKILIYFMFLQATILQHALIQVDQLNTQVENYCSTEGNLHRRRETLELHPILNQNQSSGSLDYRSLSNDSDSEQVLWITSDYQNQQILQRNLINRLINLVLEMRKKFKALQNNNKERFGKERWFHIFDTYQGLPEKFFNYHIRRLNIIFVLLRKNSCNEDLDNNLFLSNQLLLLLDEKLTTFDSFISSELEDTIEKQRSQDFKRNSNSLSEHIWEFSNSGRELSIEKSFFCFKAHLVYSCMNDSGVFLECFFLDKQNKYPVFISSNYFRTSVLLVIFYFLLL